MTKEVKRRTLALVAEIDPAELAVRIGEAMMGIPRPDGVPARDVLAGSDPVMARRFMRAAEAAASYITDCINKGQKPS